MMEMLKRVEAFPEFNIVIFDNETILNKPIEDWPLCDCLISFFSSGFPLKKVHFIFIFQIKLQLE